MRSGGSTFSINQGQLKFLVRSALPAVWFRTAQVLKQLVFSPHRTDTDGVVSNTVWQQRVVLVVDDEACVLSALSAILARAGFCVLSASSAAAALKIAFSRPEPIDLLLSDVILPGMSGPDMAEEILSVHPETRCLFIAGLTDTPEVAEKIVGRGRPLLAKPFLPVTLEGKVREVLGPRVMTVGSGG